MSLLNLLVEGQSDVPRCSEVSLLLAVAIHWDLGSYMLNLIRLGRTLVRRDIQGSLERGVLVRGQLEVVSH